MSQESNFKVSFSSNAETFERADAYWKERCDGMKLLSFKWEPMPGVPGVMALIQRWTGGIIHIETMVTDDDYKAMCAQPQHHLSKLFL